MATEDACRQEGGRNDGQKAGVCRTMCATRAPVLVQTAGIYERHAPSRQVYGDRGIPKRFTLVESVSPLL